MRRPTSEGRQAVAQEKKVIDDVRRTLEKLATKYGGDAMWRAVSRLLTKRRARRKLNREIESRRQELAALEKRR